MVAALDAGRVLDALRIAARPPEPGTRCPAELAVRLAQAAGAAMTADLAPADWLALLEAVLECAGPPHREARRDTADPAEPGRRPQRRRAGAASWPSCSACRSPPAAPADAVPAGPLSPSGGGSAAAP